MNIIFKDNVCKHEVNKTYKAKDGMGSTYFVGKYWDSEDTFEEFVYFLVDLEDGYVFPYRTLEDLDEDNPDDVEVPCTLVVGE